MLSAHLDHTTIAEIDEEEFATDPMPRLAKVFANETQKISVRSRLKEWHLAWVYGWGDPLTSDDFGLAAHFAWKSFVQSASG
jgi:hypothetical protein